MKPIRQSGPCWFCIFIWIVLYEIWAKRNGHELLTEGFYRAWKRPFGKAVIIFTIGSIHKHFFLPHIAPQLDPFKQLNKLIKPKELHVS